MELDVDRLRESFPSLASGIAHFDGPGGTQTPAPVVEAVAATLGGPLSNRGHRAASETNAERAVATFRSALADLLGAEPGGIVYGRSTTQLVYDLSRTLAKGWRAGDEVVVSRLDHDSNVRPWVQAAAAVGATVRWIDFDPGTAEVDMGSVEDAIGERTRLVAVTAASNVLGTRPPVRAIAEQAHAVGALAFVDGVHHAAHALVDVEALGADLFVCSPYKLLGPHCGVLAASPALLETLHPDKLVPSTDTVPERFELGTLPYETMAGAAAAVDFIAAMAPGDATGRRDRLRSSFRAIEDHETRLRHRLEAGIGELGDDVVVLSRAADRTPTQLLTFPGRRAGDASDHLARHDVLAPTGNFYAWEVFRRLDLPEGEALRLGISSYTTADEVDRAVAALGGWIRSGPGTGPAPR